MSRSQQIALASQGVQNPSNEIRPQLTLPTFDKIELSYNIFDVAAVERESREVRTKQNRYI